MSRTPLVVVVMGVSGCGKTAVARAAVAQLVRESLSIEFVEGDELHPPENVAKMRSGEPLTDADRHPWLDAVRERALGSSSPLVVVTCSALKRSYREHLGSAFRFVWLDVPREELLRRLAARSDHFFPPTLLDSQLATLEPPATAAVRIDAARPLAQVVDDVCAAVRKWSVD